MPGGRGPGCFPPPALGADAGAHPGELAETLVTPHSSGPSAEPIPDTRPADPASPGPAAPAGRFRKLRSHALGGLGEVFVARDAELNREVALKEIQPRHAAEADRQRRAAQAERRRAEANYEKARQAVDRMLTRVGSQRLAGVPQMERLRRELLDETLTFNRGFLLERNADPQLRCETALAHLRVAGIQRDLGERATAEKAYRDALALLEKLVADFPADAGYREKLGDGCLGLGWLLSGSRRYAEAEQAFRRCLAVREALAKEFPADRRHRQGLKWACTNLGLLLRSAGRLEEAKQELTRALALAEDLGPGPFLRLGLERGGRRAAQPGHGPVEPGETARGRAPPARLGRRRGGRPAAPAARHHLPAVPAQPLGRPRPAAALDGGLPRRGASLPAGAGAGRGAGGGVPRHARLPRPAGRRPLVPGRGPRRGGPAPPGGAVLPARPGDPGEAGRRLPRLAGLLLGAGGVLPPARRRAAPAEAVFRGGEGVPAGAGAEGGRRGVGRPRPAGRPGAPPPRAGPGAEGGEPARRGGGGAARRREGLAAPDRRVPHGAALPRAPGVQPLPAHPAPRRLRQGGEAEKTLRSSIALCRKLAEDVLAVPAYSRWVVLGRWRLGRLLEADPRRAEEGLAEYGRAIESAPREGDAWLARSCAYARLKRPEPAESDYARAERCVGVVDPPADCWWDGRSAPASRDAEGFWRAVLAGCPAEAGRAPWWAWRARGLAHAALAWKAAGDAV